MPVIKGKTMSANKVWTSPDKQRVLYEVMLNVGGEEIKAKTYSGAIARVGWEGEMETEEKTGKYGIETYVKQAQRQNEAPNRGASYGSKPMGDQFTMYLSYAKDIVVALQSTTGYNKEDFEKLLNATILGGKALYSHRPDAPKAEAPVAKEEKVYEPTDDEVNSLHELGGIFGEGYEDVTPPVDK